MSYSSSRPVKVEMCMTWHILFGILIGILGLYILYFSFRYTQETHEKYQKRIEKLRKSQMREFDLSKEALHIRMPYWYLKTFIFVGGIMLLGIDFFIFYSGVFNL